MARRPSLPPSVQREVATLYTSGTTPSEIMQAYDISNATLYRILTRLDVALREPGRRHRRTITLSERSVIVDDHSIVQAVEPTPIARPNGQVWQVHYTGVLEVHADSIDQALAEARKLPSVRRIYTVKLRGRP